MDHDVLAITWPAVTFPVQGDSIWARRNSALPTSLTVTPKLLFWIQDHGEDGCMLWRDLDLEFDPRDWDTEIHGLVYGDTAFEQAVVDWFATLGFPEAFDAPFNTEAGMQSGHHVSMQLPTFEDAPWWQPWGSVHAAMAWMATGPGGNPTSFSFQPEPR
jgi:hypothetical protein